MKHLLLFCSILTTLFEIIGNGTVAVAKTPLRVMSSNIRFNSEQDLGDTSWDARKQPYVNMIRDTKPDVIGMQEPRDAQYADLERLLPEYDRFRLLPNNQITRKQAASGMILWLKERFQCLDSGYFWLGATPYEPCLPWDATDKYHYRMAIWVKLLDNISGKEVYFFSTHLPYDPGNRPDCFDADGKRIRNIEQRTKCAKLIVSQIQQIAGKRATVFLVGDMNCSDNKNTLTYPSLIPFYQWMQSGREEAPQTDTECSYNGFGKSPCKDTWRIDHIFFRRAKPLKFQTITNSGYGVTYISDHYPITLTVEF